MRSSLTISWQILNSDPGRSILFNIKRGSDGSSMDYFLSSLLFTPPLPHSLCVFQKNSAASIFHLCLCARFTYGSLVPSARHLFPPNSKPFLSSLVTRSSRRPKCWTGGSFDDWHPDGCLHSVLNWCWRDRWPAARRSATDFLYRQQLRLLSFLT